MSVETVSTFFSVGALMVGGLVTAGILLALASLASDRVAGWRGMAVRSVSPPRTGFPDSVGRDKMGFPCADRS